MYAARLQRPTPFVDKTVYSAWNAMCVSAYLTGGQVLDLADARHFACARSTACSPKAGTSSTGMKHVIAYSDPKAEHREFRDCSMIMHSR